MTKLQIYRGQQHDGYTFSLRQHSIDELRTMRADIHPLAKIFIGFDTKSDFEKQHDLYLEIAKLLTRLNEDDLTAIGFEVIDPVQNRTLYPANA